MFKLLIKILLCVALYSCAKENEIIINGKTMGTTYIIKIINNPYHKMPSNILKKEVDSILIDYNNYFSTYIQNSEISKFNSHNSYDYFEISHQFYDLLYKSVNINNMTNGAFDITIAPIVNLWGFGPNFSIDSIPNKYEVDSLLAIVGINKITIDSLRIKKQNKYVQLDMSAIAKGAAVDQISKYLKKQKYNRFLVEIGGEVYTSGTNKNNNKWKIGIRKPDPKNLNIESYISISNQSLATSGTYENYFNLEGNNYSHIIDPEFGYPVIHDLVSATVIADSAYMSDAISTALMVMGFEKGLKWTNSHDGIECYLISKNELGEYKIGISDNFPSN